MNRASPIPQSGLARSPWYRLLPAPGPRVWCSHGPFPGQLLKVEPQTSKMTSAMKTPAAATGPTARIVVLKNKSSLEKGPRSGAENKVSLEHLDKLKSTDALRDSWGPIGSTWKPNEDALVGKSRTFPVFSTDHHCSDLETVRQV